MKHLVIIKVNGEELRLEFDHYEDALEFLSKAYEGALKCDNNPFQMTIKEGD